MSDVIKFLMVLVLLAGGWIAMDYRKAEARKFQSEAGQHLQVVQGALPGDGKPVLLEFWGTYCGPCRQSIPHLNELYGQFAGQMQFISVSAEDPSVVRDFVGRTPMKYPVAVDPGATFTSLWKVSAVPTAVFLDANQREQWRGHPMELDRAKVLSLLGN